MLERIRRRIRLRWTLAVGCLGGVAALFALSGCSVGGETCTLTGTANFSPGLGTTSKAVSYTFTGALNFCSSAALGDSTIKSGTISASGSGTAACSTSATAGTATITWNNGQTSTVSFTTTGALAAVVVKGQIMAGEFAGHSAKAVLAFQPVGGPTACTSTNGVTQANFTGETTPA